MPTPGTRTVLTLSSFAPLWLGLAILQIPGEGWVAGTFCILAAVSPLVLIGYLRAVRRIHATREVVAATSRRDQDLLAYVATYLVPFAFVAAGGWRPKVAPFVFLLLVGGLAVHARIFYVNPLLALARYRLFEIEFASGATAVLITQREHVSPGAALRLRTLDHHVASRLDHHGGEPGATRGSGRRYPGTHGVQRP